MTDNRNIAIAIVDTQQHNLAANALFNSISKFNFEQIIIYSDHTEAWGGKRVNKINPIKSINEYNKIIIKDLSRDLNCDHVLIVQYDGFIINPNQFENYFLDFDYIGAPWSHLVTNNVGNGGFSLRSKKLVDFIANIDGIDFSTPEDVLICQHLRSSGLLDSFKFASTEIANKFSFEFPMVSHETFGFHGVFNLPLIYRNNLDYFVENIPTGTLIQKFKFIYPSLNALSKHHANLLHTKYNHATNDLTKQ